MKIISLASDSEKKKKSLVLEQSIHQNNSIDYFSYIMVRQQTLPNTED